MHFLTRLLLQVCIALLIGYYGLHSLFHSRTVVSSNKTTKEFPWYTQPHLPFKATAIHPPLDLLQLKQQAQNALNVAGIRGTTFSTDKESAKVRSAIDCGTRGRWMASPHAPVSMKHWQSTIAGKCDKHALDGDTPRKATQWKWQPECPFTDASMSRWCPLLSDRLVLVVGDLMQYQLHDVLVDVTRQLNVQCYGDIFCQMHRLCEKEQVSLRYIRNDILDTTNTEDPWPKADIVTSPFIKHENNQNTILILSHTITDEPDISFANRLITTMTKIRDDMPDTLILYRAATIGHPYCDEADGPLTEPLTDSELRRLPYGWGNARQQNAIARVITEAAGGVFVDVSRATEGRPDGHVGGQDCLRYCIPGPLDAWAEQLYHALMILLSPTS